MALHGGNCEGTQLSSPDQKTFFGFDPRQAKRLDTPFHGATEEEIIGSLEPAAQAFRVLRVLIPIGPVVFGASSFPLASSVAGGDSASGFAEKNPVVA
jgi:hypothetical protein